MQRLRLCIHPDKFRLSATDHGVDFVGFVVFPDGRIRLRDANVRRFVRRFRRQAWCVRTGRMELEDLRQRTRSWIAHAGRAQSRGLRRDIFQDIKLSGCRDNTNRGVRGGSFNNDNLRSSARNNNHPTNENNNNNGFRVSGLIGPNGRGASLLSLSRFENN